MKLKNVILTGAISSIIATNAGAAVIAWGAAQDMFTGDANDASFISTNGVAIGAVNGGGVTTTVNGVVFTGLSGTQTGGQNLSVGDFEFVNHNDNDDAFTQGQFEGGTANVGTLIQSGLWAVEGVVLSNLNVGFTYEIQILSNDARGNRNDNFIAGYSDGVSAGAATISLLNNQPNTGGDGPVGSGGTTGQFVIGTFVADATTQSFDVLGTNSGTLANLNVGDSRAHVNAIQLRQTAVPEPSSILLSALAGLAFLGRRRREFKRLNNFL